MIKSNRTDAEFLSRKKFRAGRRLDINPLARWPIGQAMLPCPVLAFLPEKRNGPCAPRFRQKNYGDTGLPQLILSDI